MKKLLILAITLLFSQGVYALPNPASVFCEENGGTSILSSPLEGSYDICRFPDGSECEEWAYYNGECGPTEEIVKNYDPKPKFNLLTFIKEFFQKLF